MPYYLNLNIDGLITADSLGDGYTINLKWATAYPEVRTNKIAYNIYISAAIPPVFPEHFFDQSPTFVSVDGSTNVSIVDLIPGQMYHFAVRAVEYNPTSFDLLTLPQAYNSLRTYPESLLSNNITTTSSLISLVDVDSFPSTGTVKIGAELINYSSIDLLNNNLVLTNVGLQRGFNNTTISIHDTDGYDGSIFWSPSVLFFPVVSEEQNTRVFECWNRFDTGPSSPADKNYYPFTVADGYHQKTKDILTTDLSVSDANNANFPSYDFAGYHRTDPVLLFSGACVGSYIGGYQFCADGYNGVGQMLRGISVQDQNTQRQEVLLSLDGEKCILVKKVWTGITCDCFLPYNEYPEARCRRCYGTGFVVGYQQYFNPRRADGKIEIRFDPAVDDLIPTDSGLESTMLPVCWTLTVPTIKDRDFIIRFDVAGNEEFRYEVLNVTRNRLFFGAEGVQKFALQRVRKTDPIYQVKVFRDTSMFPSQLSTTIASSIGIPPHTHTIVISEKISSISQINQITSQAAGHSHVVQNGVVLDEGLGHIHVIILP